MPQTVEPYFIEESDAPRASRGWTFVLCDSNLKNDAISPVTDATYGWTAGQPGAGIHTKVAILRQARGKKLDMALNKPGSLSFNLPIDSDEAAMCFGYEIRRCIVAYCFNRLGVLVPRWSGPIWTTEVSAPDNKVNVSCVGWDQMLEYRILRNQSNYNKSSFAYFPYSAVQTANSQKANQATFASNPAEDLLNGNGDFENDACFEETASGRVSGILATTSQMGWCRSGASCLRTQHNITFNTASPTVTTGLPLPIVIGGRSQSAFRVQPGINYTVHGWIYVINRPTGSRAPILLNWYTSAGVFITQTGTNVASASSGGYAGVGEYEFTSVQTAPANAAYAILQIGLVTDATAGIDILWDAITVTANPTPGLQKFPIPSVVAPNELTNLITNPSFETNVTGWTGSETRTSPGVTSTFALAVATDWSSRGLQSLNGTRTVAGASGNLTDRLEYYTTVTGITAGQPYYASALCYFPGPMTGSGSHGGFSMLLTWMDAGGAVLGTSESTKSPTAIQSSNAALYPMTARHNVTATAPAGATQVRVSLGFVGYLSTNTYPARVDEVMLVQGVPPIPYIDGDQSIGLWTGAAHASTSVGPKFTRQYTPGTKLAQIIREGSEVEFGYDYYVHPISRKLNIVWSPVKTNAQIRGRGSDRTSTIFGYRAPPHNVATVRDARDSSKMANRINAVGKNSRGMAQDVNSMTTYGMFEETISLGDVVDPPPPAPSILATYAGAEVVFRMQPDRNITFTPFPYDGTARIPMVFEDYDLGDIVYLTAEHGVLKVGNAGSRQAMRIFGFTIDIDEQGNEKISSLTTRLS